MITPDIVSEQTGYPNVVFDEGVAVSDGQPLPDYIQRWIKACKAADKILPFNAVEMYADLVSVLSDLDIQIESMDDLRTKMGYALQKYNTAMGNTSTDAQKFNVMNKAIQVLLSYVTILGRLY